MNHWNQHVCKSTGKLNKPESWCWMEVALCLRNSSLKLSKFLLTKIFCISWVRTLLTISGRLLWSDTGKGQGKRERWEKKVLSDNCRKQCETTNITAKLSFLIHKSVPRNKSQMNSIVSQHFSIQKTNLSEWLHFETCLLQTHTCSDENICY